MPTPPLSETKILFISALYGMTGGITTWTRILFKHGLPDGYRMYVVDVGICNKVRARMASLWAGEWRRNMNILASLLWNLAFVRPHIVHLNSSLSGRGIWRDLVCALLVRLWCVPVVSHYRGNIPDFVCGDGQRIRLWALRKLINLSHINIAMNRGSLGCLAELHRGKRFDPVLLPNFIQDSVFRYPISRTVKPSDRMKVIYAGRIRVDKGCREILAVARQLPEMEFILLGCVGVDMDLHLQSLPANVTLGGEATFDIVWQQMSESDLFLFPTYCEGFPNAVLEAMAIGLPIVATRVGAIPEMIEDGKGGLLVSRPDTDKLVSALRTLSVDREMRLQMGAFNRRKAQKQYSYCMVILRLISLYRRLLDST